MWKYCGNVSQLGFFILYIISPFSHFISSIRFFFFSFFFLVFLLHTRCHISIPPSFIFFFSLIQEHSNTSNSRSRFFFFFFFFFSSSLSLFFFFFYLIPEHSSPTKSRWVIFVPKQLAQPIVVAYLRPQRSPNGSDGFYLLSFVSLFFLLLLLWFD